MLQLYYRNLSYDVNEKFKQIDCTTKNNLIWDAEYMCIRIGDCGIKTHIFKFSCKNQLSGIQYLIIDFCMLKEQNLSSLYKSNYMIKSL